MSVSRWKFLVRVSAKEWLELVLGDVENIAIIQMMFAYYICTEDDIYSSYGAV